MVALLLLGFFRAPFSAPQEPPKHKTLTEQVVKTPDAKNGYEDYLVAAEAVNSKECQEIASILANLARPEAERYEMTLPDWAKGKSRFEIERVLVDKFEPVLAWIKDGNSKTVYDPRGKFDETTLYPEFAAFKRIARLGSSAAKIHFAEGDPDGAAAILCEQLKFAHNIRRGSIIADLVGLTCESIAFAALEPRLGAISVSGWNNLIEVCKEQLSSETPLIDALNSERDLQVNGPQLLLKPQANDDDEESDAGVFPLDESMQRIMDRLYALTPAERKKCVDAASKKISDNIDRTVRILAGPESKWIQAVDDSSTDSLVDDIVNYMATNEVACLAEARNRVQIRMLAVHGLIQLFRLEKDRLPTSLDELKSPSLTTDPLNNKPLSFEIRGGSYRLCSRGSNVIGEFELRWRRPRANALDPIEPEIP